MTDARNVPPAPKAIANAAGVAWDADAEIWRDGGFWFDEATADKAVAFFRDHLVLSEGRWAGEPFVLEPWQENDIIRPLFGWKRADGTRRYRRCFVWVARKNGKALALTTRIPTPTGWTTMGELRVGDELFGADGHPCRVTFATPVQTGRKCYRVSMSDGTSIVADEDHQWFAKPKYGRPRVVTTLQMSASLTIGNRPTHIERNWTIQLAQALRLPSAELPIDPYVLGAWLGDGYKANSSISLGVHKAQIVSEMERRGYSLNVVPSSVNETCSAFTIRPPDGVPLMVKLRDVGMLSNKHIPVIYLRASETQRWDLLRGLIDTDGHVAPNGFVEIISVLPRLADDIVELCRSLGLKVGWSCDRARLNGMDMGPRWRIRFTPYSGCGLTLRAQHASRLRTPPERPQRSTNLKVVSIEEIESVPVRCVQVDSPDHLFLAGEGFTPTHNTEMAAGVALLALLGDAEPAGQVYSIAADKAQATLVFTKAANMISRSPTLSGVIDPPGKEVIYCPALNASFRPLSGKPGGKHGLSMSGLIGDEIHEWRDDQLYTFVHQSSAARRQPLEFLISTAGQKSGYGWDAWQECQNVLDGTGADHETLVVVYAASPDDDWTHPDTWAKANPNLGVSVGLDYLAAECAKAMESPRLENHFKRYHLNLWTEQAERWINLEAWDRCAGPRKWDELEAVMAGRRCYGGADLSQTTDLTALAYAFPPDDEFDQWVVLWRYFVPEEKVDIRVRRDKAPYDRWIKSGALLTTPGNVIDYAFVKAQIEADACKFRVEKFGFDPFNAMQLMLQLQAEGLPVEQVRQGYLTLSGPTKELERMVLDRNIYHGAQPVSRWCAGNVAVETDAAGNIKPSKAKSTERIDGVAAAVTALALAVQEGSDPMLMTSADALMVI